LWERDSEHFLGGIGFHPRNWEARAFEIGYWLRTTAAGHGYMTEAVRLLTNELFTAMGANRVEIHCDIRNARSAAVPQRLGFIQEARLRNVGRATDGTLRSTFIFALTPDDPR
jgi:RimJ/RimL family protein N-acetyltransferase